MAPNNVTVKGSVCKIALAFASGILNKAVRKKSVAHKSRILLNITKGQSVLVIDFLKAPWNQHKIETKIVTNNPRINMVCEIGILLAKYLIMVSFEI